MENFPKIENKEKELISTEILSADSLFEKIYQGDSLPKDDRFLDVEKSGVFKYFEIRDLLNHKEDKFFPVAKEGNKIIGLSELLKDPFNKNNLWIQFVSIDPKYQGNGYSSKLAREIFEFAKNHNFSLESSHYTEDGFEKLKPVFEKLAEEYSDVNFINKGKLH